MWVSKSHSRYSHTSQANHAVNSDTILLQSFAWFYEKKQTTFHKAWGIWMAFHSAAWLRERERERRRIEMNPSLLGWFLRLWLHTHSTLVLSMSQTDRKYTFISWLDLQSGLKMLFSVCLLIKESCLPFGQNLWWRNSHASLIRLDEKLVWVKLSQWSWRTQQAIWLTTLNILLTFHVLFKKSIQWEEKGSLW